MRVSFKVCKTCVKEWKKGLEPLSACSRLPVGNPWGLRRYWRFGRVWCPHKPDRKRGDPTVTAKYVPKHCPYLMEHGLAWARRKG